MDKNMRAIFIIICVLISTLSFSQDKVELLNKGNKYFQEGDFEKAEHYYKQSLETDNKYYKANLNTGHALFRQAFSLIQQQDTSGLKKCSEAELFYNNSTELTKNKNEKAESLYNLGNSQLLGQKLEKSIESYKKSLRLISENMNAKHNLALAQYLLNKKQDNQENQKDSKKEQEEKKSEEEKNQNQENNQQHQSKEELSKEEIDQILNALERKDKEVQEDLQEKKVIDGNKLLKDW